MTRQEFVDQLIENGINPDIVLFDFDNNVRDGYCIRKTISVGRFWKGKGEQSFVVWVSRRRVMH